MITLMVPPIRSRLMCRSDFKKNNFGHIVTVMAVGATIPSGWVPVGLWIQFSSYYVWNLKLASFFLLHTKYALLHPCAKAGAHTRTSTHQLIHFPAHFQSRWYMIWCYKYVKMITYDYTYLAFYVTWAYTCILFGESRQIKQFKKNPSGESYTQHEWLCIKHPILH